jgi:hypothetical protein
MKPVKEKTDMLDDEVDEVKRVRRVTVLRFRVHPREWFSQTKVVCDSE